MTLDGPARDDGEPWRLRPAPHGRDAAASAGGWPAAAARPAGRSRRRTSSRSPAACSRPAQRLRFEETGELDCAFGIGASRASAATCSPSAVPLPPCTASSPSVFARVPSLTCRRQWRPSRAGRTGSCSSPVRPAAASPPRSRRFSICINSERDGHILTIEDPIEFIHPHKRCVVNQREIHTDTRGFAGALRAALREDPDVVLIGEMRDLETIEAALRIAETGHLTFGTLHTSSAAQTITRVIDVFPAHQQAQVRTQLSLVLEGVVCQALLPRIGGGRVAALEILVPRAQSGTSFARTRCTRSTRPCRPARRRPACRRRTRRWRGSTQAGRSRWTRR